MGSVYPSPDTTRRLVYCRVAQEFIAVAEVTALNRLLNAIFFHDTLQNRLPNISRYSSSTL